MKFYRPPYRKRQGQPFPAKTCGKPQTACCPRLFFQSPGAPSVHIRRSCFKITGYLFLFYQTLILLSRLFVGKSILSGLLYSIFLYKTCITQPMLGCDFCRSILGLAAANKVSLQHYCSPALSLQQIRGQNPRYASSDNGNFCFDFPV